MNDKQPLQSFRNSPWRYSQFVIVGLVVAGLVHLLSPLGGLLSLLVGAVAGVGYLMLEKKRGVI